MKKIKLNLQSDGWIYMKFSDFEKNVSENNKQKLLYVKKFIDNEKYKDKVKTFSVCRIINTKTQKLIAIPRMRAIEMLNIENVNTHRLKNGDDINIDVSSIKLRDYQKDAIKSIKKAYDSGLLGGVLKMSTGSGKTYTSLCAAAEIGKKTLIITDNKEEQRKWIKVSKEIIGNCVDCLLSSDTQEEMIKKIDENNVIITMHHALYRGKFKVSSFYKIGLVIIDELQTYMTMSYIKMFRYISRRFILGMTATDTRQDKLHYLIPYFVGKIIYEKNNCYTGVYPLVKMINYHGPDEFTKILRGTKNETQCSKMVTQISKDPYRNNMILSIIKKEIKNPGVILVMSLRINQLKLLFDKCKEYNPGLIIGAKTKKETDKVVAAYDKKLIFCSLNIGKKGLDILNARCMILSNSFKTADGGKHKESLDQLTGRILRQNWKIQPIIWAINDMFTFFAIHQKLRRDYYLECGFEVEHIKIKYK